ncbi:MAG: FHA domain-containing protein, partial [Planctomycetota bacterium]
MRRLEVIHGRTAPTEVEIEGEGEVLIGRTRDAALRLFDETASRRHARIRLHEGRVLLEDLDSANGTRLNGERIEGPATLFDGDVIAIGDVEIRFLSGDGADRDTVAAPAAADAVEAAVDPDAADPAAEAAGEGAIRRLRFVCDSATAFADAGTSQEITDNLLAMAVETFAPDRATVLLLPPAGRGGADVVAAHPPGASPPGSKTLRQRVVEAGEAVLIRDASDSEVREAASLVRSRYRSTLAAPLKTTEGV